MESQEVVAKVADMLKDHELIIAELYGVMAEKHPEDAELWSVMKAEEEGHGRFVEKLKARLVSGDIRFVLGRLHVPTLEKSTESVRAEIERVKRTDVTRVTALGCALAIENGLLDHGFYNIIDESSVMSRQLKSAMFQSIESHVARLYTMYVRARDEESALRKRDAEQAVESKPPVDLRPREDIWPEITPREEIAYDLEVEKIVPDGGLADVSPTELREMHQKLHGAVKMCSDSIGDLTNQIETLKPVIEKVENALKQQD